MQESEFKTGEREQMHIADADELLHHHTQLPQTALSQRIDAGFVWFGKLVSWAWLAVVGVIIYAVVGRYAFGQGSVTLEEWQWHIAGGAWLLGLSYALTADDHVRVDVLHERMSLKTQGWVEFFGITLLLLPFLGAALYEAMPYAYASFTQGERSQAPAGLDHRWILKGIVALSFALLILAALSRLLRVTALLFGLPTPVKTSESKEAA
ncbi:MAG: TRAP transporter small permease subunit [Mangrovicoccus sp.]|nr:TRAP transporter small permease subunit [Mangrovicoccus sp.]